MKITFNEYNIVIEREKGDPKFYGHLAGSAESKLLYALKIELNKQGYDLIKKRMYKDGHLVDDIQQYLRTRKKGSGKGDFYIYNAAFATYDSAKAFNEGRVELSVERNVFK